MMVPVKIKTLDGFIVVARIEARLIGRDFVTRLGASEFVCADVDHPTASVFDTRRYRYMGRLIDDDSGASAEYHEQPPPGANTIAKFDWFFFGGHPVLTYNREGLPVRDGRISISHFDGGESRRDRAEKIVKELNAK